MPWLRYREEWAASNRERAVLKPSNRSPVLLGPYVVDGADGGVFTKQPITGGEDDLLRPGPDVSLGCVMST